MVLHPIFMYVGISLNAVFNPFVILFFSRKICIWAYMPPLVEHCMQHCSIIKCHNFFQIWLQDITLFCTVPSPPPPRTTLKFTEWSEYVFLQINFSSALCFQALLQACSFRHPGSLSERRGQWLPIQPTLCASWEPSSASSFTTNSQIHNCKYKYKYENTNRKVQKLQWLPISKQPFAHLGNPHLLHLLLQIHKYKYTYTKPVW